MSRVDIIDMVRDSKLKGRGGAGFPTGIKWNFAAAEKRTPKYIMCNADEGEPGTFKDRLILSEYPDLVMEGMTIGARAIGASLGLIYLRAEYALPAPPSGGRASSSARTPACSARTSAAIEGFNFNIMVAMGAGAYVCGEETALIESLEGLPRRAAQPAAVPGGLGLPATGRRWSTTSRRSPGCPASSPRASTGSRASAPTTPPATSCSASPATARSPACTSSPSGSPSPSCSRRWAARTPRPCRSAERRAAACRKKDFERRLAFEDIPTGGSVIVIGPGRDMLDLAHNLMDFFVDESCGQCTPCRLGNAKLLEGVEMLKEGTCTAEYLDDLKGSPTPCRWPPSAAWARPARWRFCPSSSISEMRSMADNDLP